MPARGPALLRMHRSLCAGALLAASLGMPRPADGQVNVEGLRRSLTGSGVHGALSGSLTTYHGNTMGSELGGTALVGYREARNLVYLSTGAAPHQTPGRGGEESDRCELLSAIGP